MSKNEYISDQIIREEGKKRFNAYLQSIASQKHNFAMSYLLAEEKNEKILN